MRITNSMLLRTALADVTRQRLRFAHTQEKASSGLAINRPSDDPVGASAALLLRAGINATLQYQRNVTQARNRISVLEAAIGSSTSTLIEAKTVAIEGANGTADAGTRMILAGEIESLHGRLMAEANSRSTQTYVFGGFSTDAQPFTASGPFAAGAPSPSVSFVGDSSEVQTPIDDGVSVSTTLDGRRIFLGDADGDGSPEAGRQDIFALLGTLRDALVNDDQAAIAATIDDFDEAIDQLNVERTRIGVADLKLSDWQFRLAERELRLETRRSETEDADAAEVFSDLVNQENALRAVLDTMSRVMQPSLLDFLA